MVPEEREKHILRLRSYKPTLENQFKKQNRVAESALSAHMNHHDALVFWVRRLRTHFKNSRSKNCENLPVILSKRATFSKRKMGDENVADENNKKARRAWGIQNYLPEREEGEDEISQAELVEIVQKQARLVVRNKDLSSHAMKKTFPDRRKMITVEMAQVASVVDRYPLLTIDQEVIQFKFVVIC